MTEIDTTEENLSAYEVILRCKSLADNINAKKLVNLDNETAIKIMNLIKYLKSLELEIIEYEPPGIES